MDLASLMNSLTVNEKEDSASSNLNIFALKIGEYHTDIVFGNFTHQHMLIATQNEKIASLLKVTKDQVGETSDTSKPVFSVNLIFGEDNLEQQAAARFVAEKLDIQKPFMVFLCLKDYEKATVLTLVDGLLNVVGKINS